MSPSDRSNPASGNGTGEPKHLLDFVRESREILVLAPGSVLFQEGAPCRGAFFVEEGELYLTIASGEKRLTVGTAKAGHLLAISSVVSNCDYQCSAHAARECKLAFIPAAELRQYLREHAEVCLRTVQQLGAELLELSENAIRPLRLQPRYPKP